MRRKDLHQFFGRERLGQRVGPIAADRVVQRLARRKVHEIDVGQGRQICVQSVSVAERGDVIVLPGRGETGDANHPLQSLSAAAGARSLLGEHQQRVPRSTGVADPLVDRGNTAMGGWADVDLACSSHGFELGHDLVDVHRFACSDQDLFDPIGRAIRRGLDHGETGIVGGRITVDDRVGGIVIESRLGRHDEPAVDKAASSAVFAQRVDVDVMQQPELLHIPNIPGRSLAGDILADDRHLAVARPKRGQLLEPGRRPSATSHGCSPGGLIPSALAQLLVGPVDAAQGQDFGLIFANDVPDLFSLSRQKVHQGGHEHEENGCDQDSDQNGRTVAEQEKRAVSLGSGHGCSPWQNLGQSVLAGLIWLMIS